MISKPILKQLFRYNIVAICIFIGILAMYNLILVGMYSPEFVKQMAGMSDSMGSLGSLKGMDNVSQGFGIYYASTYFNMTMPMFLVIYNIILGNKVIASRVDKGSMASLLASPNTRNKISITSMLFLVLSNIFILLTNSVIGYIAVMVNKHADLKFSEYCQINLGAIIIMLCISSITFVFSCIFSDSKKSLTIGGGIPILFLIFTMISDMGEGFKVFKKLTIFSLYKPDKIFNDEFARYYMYLGILAVIAIVLYTIGIKVFNKKDLSV